MKTLLTAVFAAVVVSLAAPAAGACKGKSETTASNTDKKPAAQKSGTVDAAVAPVAEAFKLVSVEQVDQQLTALKTKKGAVAIFDANAKETRVTVGIIPTAVLLTSASTYDLAVLPADKASPLVFYCSNEKCTASHTAAKRAAAAGHTNVAVLGAGIKGWVAAGKAVDKPVS